MEAAVSPGASFPVLLSTKSKDFLSVPDSHGSLLGSNDGANIVRVLLVKKNGIPLEQGLTIYHDSYTNDTMVKRIDNTHKGVKSARFITGNRQL